MQDESILNKYRNPAKVSSPKEDTESKRPVKTKTKEKKQNLNDSWDKAWEDDFTDINKYSTYNQPAPKKSQPLDNGDNFNFDEMKTNLNPPKKSKANKNQNEDDFDDYFNNIDEPAAKQNDERKESLNLNKIVNAKLNSKPKQDEGFDFFDQNQDVYGGGSDEQITVGLNNQIKQSNTNVLDADNDSLSFFQNQPQQPISSPPVQQTNNELDDIFGGAPAQTNLNAGMQNMGINQPSKMNTFSGSNTQSKPKNMFGSDASDIFNTTPMNMMNQGYNTGSQGYGMYNQNYSMNNQNYGMDNQSYGMDNQNYGSQMSSMFNTAVTQVGSIPNSIRTSTSSTPAMCKDTTRTIAKTTTPGTRTKDMEEIATVSKTTNNQVTEETATTTRLRVTISQAKILIYSVEDQILLESVMSVLDAIGNNFRFHDRVLRAAGYS